MLYNYVTDWAERDSIRKTTPKLKNDNIKILATTTDIAYLSRIKFSSWALFSGV